MNQKTKPQDSLDGNQNGKRKKENKRLKIGTWNIKTLFKTGALRILIGEVNKYNSYNSCITSSEMDR